MFGRGAAPLYPDQEKAENLSTDFPVLRSQRKRKVNGRSKRPKQSGKEQRRDQEAYKGKVRGGISKRKNEKAGNSTTCTLD